MANAMWHVRYVDKTVPYHAERMLSLMSRDSLNPRKAHKLARAEAAKRLTKKLGKGKFVVLSSECVG
jgi:hypothetical protein